MKREVPARYDMIRTSKPLGSVFDITVVGVVSPTAAGDKPFKKGLSENFYDLDA